MRCVQSQNDKTIVVELVQECSGSSAFYMYMLHVGT